MRRGPHAKTYLTWQLLLGSLILDPLIPLISPLRIPLDLASTIATWCAIGILPFLAQDRVHRVLSKLRLFHNERLHVGSKAVPLTIGLGAGMVVLCKLLLFADLPNTLLVPLLLLALWASRAYVTQVITQTTQDKALFASNPWAKVERWEHQVMVFAMLPLLLARAIALCGDVAELSADHDHIRLLFIGVSAIFLGMLRPERSFFVGLCRTCKHPVPIVFQDIGSCLSCDVRLRIAYHAWTRRVPIEQLLNPQNTTETSGDPTSAETPPPSAKR